MSVALPRPASTVVIVRPSDRQPCEVLMVRRNDKVAFMAGAFVFPGGRVDESDRVGDPSASCEGLEALPRFPDLTAAEELPYRVAALRELEEEASLLLARRDAVMADAPAAARVREALVNGTSLPEAVATSGYKLALDALFPFAHWVTPEIEARRYDTRFFLALMPEGQTARHDAGETADLVWVSPADALARCRDGEMMLPPPTWTTLARLARFERLDDVLAWARTAAIVRVQPAFIRDGQTTMLTLPGDPSYPSIPGWEVPDHTRFVLEEGRGWRAIQA